MIKRQKYNTRKFQDEDGNTFDSKREYLRYQYLLQQEASGNITDLKRQSKWELIPELRDPQTNKILQRATYYFSDFSYLKEGILVVEDVKISPKMIPQDYRLKEKMFFYRYKFPIRRVYDPEEEI